MNDYLTEFERLNKQIVGLTPSALLSYFISGLYPKLRRESKPSKSRRWHWRSCKRRNSRTDDITPGLLRLCSSRLQWVCRPYLLHHIPMSNTYSWRNWPFVETRGCVTNVMRNGFSVTGAGHDFIFLLQMMKMNVPFPPLRLRTLWVCPKSASTNCKGCPSQRPFVSTTLLPTTRSSFSSMVVVLTISSSQGSSPSSIWILHPWP